MLLPKRRVRKVLVRVFSELLVLCCIIVYLLCRSTDGARDLGVLMTLVEVRSQTSLEGGSPVSGPRCQILEPEPLGEPQTNSASANQGMGVFQPRRFLGRPMRPAPGDFTLSIFDNCCLSSLLPVSRGQSLQRFRSKIPPSSCVRACLSCRHDS